MSECPRRRRLVQRASVEIDFPKTQERLERHRLEYLGKWVVLDEDRLIGSGDDPRPIVQEARAQGVKTPPKRSL